MREHQARVLLEAYAQHHIAREKLKEFRANIGHDPVPVSAALTPNTAAHLKLPRAIIEQALVAAVNVTGSKVLREGGEL